MTTIAVWKYRSVADRDSGDQKLGVIAGYASDPRALIKLSDRVVTEGGAAGYTDGNEKINQHVALLRLGATVREDDEHLDYYDRDGTHL